MEVVNSPPERAFTELPEAMEIAGEKNAKIFLFGEPNEAQQPFSTSFMEELESTETDQQESGIFLKFGKAETEEIETNQVSVFNAFSFAWEKVMQLLFAQAAGEIMETDQETVAASPCVAQLEEIMETMQEPFQMPIPFGLVGDSNLPVAAEVNFWIPVQEETMETQELGDAFKSVEIKFGELVDAKRPLASTVGMPKEETMLTNTPATEEPVVQLSCERTSSAKCEGTSGAKCEGTRSAKCEGTNGANCEGTSRGSLERTNHTSSIAENRVATIDKTQRINL